MIDGSSISRLSVLAVLYGSGVNNLKKFGFAGYTFSPDILKLLAQEIQVGTLEVMYETKKMGGKAIYNSTENRLYVGFWSAGSLSRQALIVHELTHAMFDFQALKMDVATSEAMAYIVQCQYAKANSESSDPEDRLYSSNEAKDKVFEVGWRIAGKILEGGAVDQSDVNDIRGAVSGHPEYAKDATASAGYDGYIDRV